MSDRDTRDDAVDEHLVPGSGAGGPVVTTSDNSLFGAEPAPAPDSRGVNEEDIGVEDEGLMDAGGSPEFDHSLRRRPTNPS